MRKLHFFSKIACTKKEVCSNIDIKPTTSKMMLSEEDS